MPRAPINGTELFYDQQGEGEVLLFHHGYTGSHDAWAEVVPAFKDRYRCIVMDARGAGDSAHPAGGYSIRQYAADIAAMADHLGVGKFTYIGHSMGGVIGMELGLNYPERLDRLVLVAPAPADGIQYPGMEAERERARKLWRERDLATRLEEAVALAGRPDADLLRRNVLRGFSVSEGHFEESWEDLVNYRAGDRLGEIKTPTLMMAGAADGLLPANLADFQRLGNATLHVFSRVGHGMEYEAPAEFNAVLADFLEHGVVTARTLMRKLRESQAALSR
ncbi:MAG: alpha/beta hydrolase [Chloroflexi bacterium]|nr:alpha/beta hydrolase [Chloroflexota bacterium]